MHVHWEKERRSAARIEVDAVLLYRAVGMDSFKPCSALSASTHALEIVSERSIPIQTYVTIKIETDESPKRYSVYGMVTKREQRQAGWRHIVTTSPQRPWPPEFLYDVVCSTYESSRDEVTGRSTYRKKICAELDILEANLDAWEAIIHLNQTQPMLEDRRLPTPML